MTVAGCNDCHSPKTLLPPMLWSPYARMTDDDLKAVYANVKAAAPPK